VVNRPNQVIVDGYVSAAKRMLQTGTRNHLQNRNELEGTFMSTLRFRTMVNRFLKITEIPGCPVNGPASQGNQWPVTPKRGQPKGQSHFSNAENLWQPVNRNREHHPAVDIAWIDAAGWSSVTWKTDDKNLDEALIKLTVLSRMDQILSNHNRKPHKKKVVSGD
jgi:hypothetical protein